MPGIIYLPFLLKKHLTVFIFHSVSNLYYIFAGFLIYNPVLLLTLVLSRWRRLLVRYQHQICSDGPLCDWGRSQCHPYHQVAHAWQGGSNWFMVYWMIKKTRSIRGWSITLICDCVLGSGKYYWKGKVLFSLVKLVISYCFLVTVSLT